jgi:hypothetical protein
MLEMNLRLFTHSGGIMANEITIPALPCGSISDTITFYTALGFEITYQQTRPNNYACVKRDAIELHFFTMRDYKPADSYSTCLVQVDDIEALNQAFTAGLRQHYGKLPIAGIPRINKVNTNNVDREKRFNLVDPGGNWIRFFQRRDIPNSQDTADSDEAPANATLTKLARAFRSAELMAEHGDYAPAAKMLDTALAHAETESSVLRVKAMVARAGWAATMDDPQHAHQRLAEIQALTLTDDERASLADELLQAADIGALLTT